MKGKLIIITAAVIVAAAVWCIGCTFRWVNATDGYQEYIYKTTNIDNSKVPNAVPGKRYEYSDEYLVTYRRKAWPVITTENTFIDRAIVDIETGKPLPKSKPK